MASSSQSHLPCLISYGKVRTREAQHPPKLMFLQPTTLPTTQLVLPSSSSLLAQVQISLLSSSDSSLKNLKSARTSFAHAPKLPSLHSKLPSLSHKKVSSETRTLASSFLGIAISLSSKER